MVKAVSTFLPLPLTLLTLEGKLLTPYWSKGDPKGLIRGQGYVTASPFALPQYKVSLSEVKRVKRGVRGFLTLLTLNLPFLP